jgi:hypothetical protein
MVRKKINGLLTACRRELKKITDSTKYGIGIDDIYVPSLWYFDDRFLPTPRNSGGRKIYHGR